jgi:hypothetical protein
MANRTYPYKAWTLTPSFKPVQVEFVSLWKTWDNPDYGDLTATKRKVYRRDEIYETAELAIEAGYMALLAQQVKLEKMLAAVRKKREALVKAEGERSKVGAQ